MLRLEARAAVVNGRGNGALRKIGAVQEGVLRRSFHRGGQFHDQVLWSMLAEDWHLQRVLQRGASTRSSSRYVARASARAFQGCPSPFFARAPTTHAPPR